MIEYHETKTETNIDKILEGLNLKICKKCKENKANSEYGKERNECKSCRNKYYREYRKGYYAENRELIQSKNNVWKNGIGKETHSRYVRKYNLKKLYGITIEQYDELLEKQNHRCAVCLRHESEFNKRLAVDHEHGKGKPNSGRIFGLLCAHCNHRVIGRVRDADKFKRAAHYLANPMTDWFVPVKEKKKRKKR